MARSSSTLRLLQLLQLLRSLLPPLALLQLQGIDGTAISGAIGGLQLAGSAATLGLGAQSRANYLMGQRSLDLRAPARGAPNPIGSIKLRSGPSMGPIQVQSSLGSAFGVAEPEFEEHFELDQLAGGLGDIAPPECYDNLFNRFRRWQAKFKKLQQQSQGAFNETEIIDRAFGEAGRRLLEEECEPGTEGWSDGHDHGELDNPLESLGQKAKQMSDFIYKTLNNIVNNLDNILNTYSQYEPFINELVNFDGTGAETNEQRVMILMDRLKDRAIDYAKKQIKIKINSYQKQALELGSQMLVDFAGYPGDPMSYIWAMRQAFYSNSLNKVQDLLSNLPFRGAIAFINHQNPMPFMRCKPKQKEQEPYC